MNALGTTVNRLRARRGLTQPMLGARAGVSEDWIRRLETGKLSQAEHHLAHIRALAAALGYSFAGFLREAGMIEPEGAELPGDPGLRELVANYSQLSSDERQMVENLIRVLARRGEKAK